MSTSSGRLCRSAFGARGGSRQPSVNPTKFSRNGRKLPSLLACLCLLGAALLPRTAGADGESAAADAARQAKDLDAHVQRANQAVREEKSPVAVQEWARSYVLQPTPEFLFNLAEACRKTNQPRDARFYYERYLREAPQGALRGQASARLNELSNNPNARIATTGQIFNEHQTRGLQEYTKQNYEAAAVEFSLAYALAPRLQLLPNLGRILQRTGQISEALTIYETYLRSTPAGAERDKLSAVVAQLREQVRPPVNPPPAVAVPPTAPVADPSPPVAPPGPSAVPPSTLPPAAASVGGTEAAVAPPASPRPAWAPYVEVRAGLVFSGRELSFSAPGGVGNGPCLALQDASLGRFLATPCPRYSMPLALGAHITASVFPLAGVRSVAVRGLGLTAHLDFTPSAQACANPDDQGGCMGGQLDAYQLRAEVGLRWRWLLGQSLGRPRLSALAQYGYHRWAFASPAEPMNFRSLPSTTYQYVDVGVGLEIPLKTTGAVLLQLELQAHYHAMLGYGELARGAQTAEDAGYGPVDSGHGMRLELSPIEVRPWKGLAVRPSVHYELFTANFRINQAGQAPADETRFIAQGFLDHYFAAMMQAGYVY